ncbi:prepilin-type N-terminal cleavage/methylation domain-containing protein [candidate division TA06 bacterium]|uniref:Prepilin-type N-terminal cleavage/methylation domain-containing protein n=1 Tax=candidate division TA06 bacterium TaxID=2250710 RepID=A0A523UW32_UNCT6|nr:MAG: prepilin-type N-terminal cleavage/methylation domain-containing protein [candidate division TA06 bacterium]
MNIKLKVKDRGFSLVELLVVMIVGSIIMAAIYSIVFGSKEALMRGESEARTSYRARRTMRRLVEDFRLAGYGLAAGELGIITAKENELVMVADLDKNGMTETIRYYLSHSSELGNTPNPNDRILYKSIGGENPGLPLAVGITSFVLGFYDSDRVDLLDPISSPKQVDPLKDLNGNKKNDLIDIRLITVRVVFERAAPDKHGGYRPYAVSSSMSPRNLRLLAFGGGGTVGDTIITLAADPDIIRADGSSISNLTATVTTHGAAVAGDSVYCFIVSGGGSISPEQMIDNGDGTYSSTYYSSTTPGDVLIMAVDSTAILAATETILLTGEPDSISVEADPDTIIADGNSISILTAIVFDSLGNQIPGETVSIEITSNNTGATMEGGVEDKGNGKYTRKYKASLSAGTDTVTATCEALSAITPMSTIVGPTDLQIWAEPDTIIADTTYTSVITALVLSGEGDSLPGEPVTIDFDENMPGATWATGVEDSGNGLYYRTMRASNTQGDVLIKATDGPVDDTTRVLLRGLLGGQIEVGEIVKVTIGDFGEDNNDDPDIFVSHKSDTVDLSVFLNMGNDGFGHLYSMEEIIFDAEGEVIGMALGNFDSLKTDVCLILRKAKRIELAMNDLNGDFADSSFAYALRRSGRSGAAGDIDGDGDIDVLAGTDEKKTEVWLNDGNANLTFHVKVTHFEKPNALCLADFGEDTLGDLDIAAGTEAKDLEILFNDGGGDFHTDGVYRASDRVRALDTGDLNGDGYIDVVCGTSAGKMEVWLNNGAGTFPSSPDYVYSLSESVLSIAIGDVQEDTLGDLDVAAGTEDGVLTVWYNQGTGALTESDTSYSHTGKLTGLDIGDLVEDEYGDNDIVAGTDVGGGVGIVHIWLNNGDGTFTRREN